MRHADHEANGRDEEALAPLLRLAHEAGDGETDEAAGAREKARFVSALTAKQARSAPRWGRRLGLLAAAALVFIALLVGWPRHHPLQYAVEGGEIAAGGFVAAGRGAPATLRFSDGSTLVLAEAARARVAEVSAHGARVVLEDGDAHVHVIHAAHTAWSIEAGPFSVTVTGTAFDVGFHAVEQTLTVRMTEGTVIVRGPAAPAGVALHAGQRLVAGSTEGSLSIEADVAPPAVTALPVPAPEAPSVAEMPAEPRRAAALPTARPAPLPTPSSSASSAVTAEPAAASAPSAAPVPPPASWAQRVAKGDFAGVLADADARGLDGTLAGATLSDLAALADAARYGGKMDLARRALAAERTRFPGSREAANATFLLGRIADDAQGAPAAAVALYDRYLVESPGGAFAEEALGRKMVALRRSGGREAARPSAVDYLRRYPSGAFATAARELTQDP